MLSLQRCRELVDPNCTLSDATLELIRDHLYAIADIATAQFLETQQHSPAVLPGSAAQLNETLKDSGMSYQFSEISGSLHPEDLFNIEERAAILEFDAGMNRSQAEHVALEEYRRAHRVGGKFYGSFVN